MKRKLPVLWGDIFKETHTLIDQLLSVQKFEEAWRKCLFQGGDDPGFPAAEKPGFLRVVTIVQGTAGLLHWKLFAAFAD